MKTSILCFVEEKMILTLEQKLAFATQEALIISEHMQHPNQSTLTSLDEYLARHIQSIQEKVKKTIVLFNDVTPYRC